MRDFDNPGMFSTSDGDKAVATIKNATKEIRNLATNLKDNAGPFLPLLQPMLVYLVDWAARLDASAVELEKALGVANAAREDVADALGASSSCASFDISVVRVLAALRRARQDLVKVWGSLMPQSFPLRHLCQLRIQRFHSSGNRYRSKSRMLLHK